MNTEIWKEINNFSKYEISNYGNLKNKDTQKILHPSIKSGYLCASLTDNNGIRKPVKIHRLVALNFIPNVENKETVNHINHNRLDNNIKNLEWMTTTEQNNHRRKCKKEIQELLNRKLGNDKIRAISDEGMIELHNYAFAGYIELLKIFDNKEPNDLFVFFEKIKTNLTIN